MPIITEAGKIRRNRGKGHGADYKPWILTREYNSRGTTANIVDWKHGRTTQLLSQGEEWYYYVLRWDDRVVDIREQFPLELEDTVRIADQLGVRHPKNRRTRMTTDMLVDYDDGKQVAYSIKDSRKAVDHHLAQDEKEQKKVIRTMEKLLIEKFYWQEKGVKWKLLYKEDLNPIYVNNIRRIVLYYDERSVHDEISMLKHRLAVKELVVDLSKELDYWKIIREGGWLCPK